MFTKKIIYNRSRILEINHDTSYQQINAFYYEFLGKEYR